MKNVLLIYVSILLIAACSPEKNKMTASDSIEIVFYSSDEAPINIDVDFTNEEQKRYVNRFTVLPSNSVKIPLAADVHLLGVELYPTFYKNILVSKGDKIIVENAEGELSFYKINNDKKEVINVVEHQIIFDIEKYKNLQEQSQNIITINGTSNIDHNAKVNSFLVLNKAYYDDVFERIRTKYKSKEKQDCLIKFAKVEQYKKLTEINEKINSDVLTEFLKSEQFLNEKNLDDRILSRLFGIYSYYNHVGIRRNKSLTEIYKSDFNTFSVVLQGYFKRSIIHELINGKYDRKVISLFIDDYEKSYGKHGDIEEMKKEIEYGVRESKDLQLIGIDNKPETWETLTRKWKGKKIYVDFWASWCQPCIAELPHSKKIKKQFNDVIFIYLALNDKEAAWREAAKKYDVLTNSYLITNSKSSGFITEHGIQSIPRYMILNKSGKIINPDAPRPSSGNIIQVLKED